MQAEALPAASYSMTEDVGVVPSSPVTLSVHGSALE